MGLDIRTPIGILFVLLGAILAAFGAMTHGSEIYRRSFDFNVNLGWGALLLLFGLAMLLLRKRRGKSD